MAKGRKTGGRDFGPGNNANPNGRPPLPAEIRQIQALTKERYIALLNKYLDMPFDELQRIGGRGEESRKARAGLPVIEVTIASVLSRAILDGDANRLEAFLIRLMGKPPQKLEHSGPGGGAINFRDMTPAARKQHIQELQERLGNGGETG